MTHDPTASLCEKRNKPASMTRHSRFVALAAFAAVLTLTRPSPTFAASQPAADHQASEPHGGAEPGGHTEEAEHDESLLAFLSRLGNFAILAGGLVYFLKQPIADYLASRARDIRRDLVDAQKLRETATHQLAEIDRKLKALPGEIDELKRRGASEIAAEEARIRDAAEADRQRLLDQSQREIDARVRTAKRELVELAADLAVASARERLRSETTAEDQLKLIDSYVSKVKTVAREDRA
ncbi:MAG: hypothetical protein U0Q12_09850 [Vicinamibacterales bacterium]